MNIAVSEVQADLLDNNRSTEQTVAAMAHHIQAAMLDPAVYKVGANLAASSSGSRRDLAASVWEWCHRNIRFAQDEDLLAAQLGRRDELELLISPSVMVRSSVKQGDCDDYTMMACSLLSFVGLPAYIKTFKCDRRDPERWSHVCAATALEDGSIFPLDASHGDYPGWQVPADDIFESQLWDMDGKRVGGNGMGRFQRGVGAYRSAPGWTGDPSTTVTGREAGPYSPANDIRSIYQKRCDRMAGLGFIRRAGLGDAVDLGGFFSEETGGGSSAGATPTLDQMLQNDTGGGTFGDLSSYFSQLVGAGTTLGAAALGYKPGMAVPPGYALNAQGQLVKIPSTSSGISTNMLLIGGAVVAVIALVALKK